MLNIYNPEWNHCQCGPFPFRFCVCLCVETRGVWLWGSEHELYVPEKGISIL